MAQFSAPVTYEMWGFSGWDHACPMQGHIFQAASGLPHFSNPPWAIFTSDAISFPSLTNCRVTLNGNKSLSEQSWRLWPGVTCDWLVVKKTDSYSHLRRCDYRSRVTSEEAGPCSRADRRIWWTDQTLIVRRKGKKVHLFCHSVVKRHLGQSEEGFW